MIAAHQGTEYHDLRRRRRERYIIAFLILIISALTTYLFIKSFSLGLDLPIANSILVFALIDLNVILLLLLLFLTIRNIVKLVFERRKGILGAKLRTKLVLAFILLSLLPTIVLFFVSVQFISTSVENWFNLPIESSLKNSLEVGQGYYNKIIEDMVSTGNDLSRLITYQGYTLLSKTEPVEKLISEKRREHRLSSVKVFSQNLQLRASSQDEKLDLSPFEDPSADLLKKAYETGSDTHEIQSSPHGQLVSGIVPVFSRTESKAVVGILVLQKFIPGSFVNRLNAISSGLEEFKQFKLLKKPIKTVHLMTLSIVTLLIIFSALWFGFRLSKGITVPIQELAEGTHRVASGDYDFSIDLEAKDEIGVLVNSFNLMTKDLRESKNQLDSTNEELRKSNIELEQRRAYMEIVLANVAAGVVAADAEGKIFTINKSAAKMLNITAEKIIGKRYDEVLGKDYAKLANELFQNKTLLRRGSMKRQIRLFLENRTLSLLVSLNVLRDDRGKDMGLVAVFEDLTDIEKAQRMAAWREVARRIAHEVKNPLTPIQLSAQRLKKRYATKLGLEDEKVFEECTNMIIDQVEGLRRLVNEFSNYARMPAPNLTRNSVRQIIEESLSLYKEAQKDVRIVFHHSADVPEMKVDREQLKRSMINLIDNAMDAVDGKGEISIDLSYDQDQQMVRIEVADNGKGIPPEYKPRVFEPYFSTKKHGTGLGLAIVSNIVSDHSGAIRVEDMKPRGTKFIVELPVKD
jgi:two-component system nitrogen regulation sensor histidine kinase NtrY